MKSFLSIFFVCIGLHALAQDGGWNNMLNSDYIFRGFSADLVYAAYEMNENVAHSNPEQKLTQVFVINVDKNSYATRHFEYTYDSATVPAFRRKYDSVYRVIQNKFNIHGDYLGNAVHFGEPKTIDSATIAYNFNVGAKLYSLLVKNIPVANGKTEYEVPEVMVDVSAILNSTKTILQAPQRASSSWGITTNYRLLNAYINQNKIAVFIAYETAGFEGPGTSHQMIVTGVLK